MRSGYGAFAVDPAVGADFFKDLLSFRPHGLRDPHDQVAAGFQ